MTEQQMQDVADAGRRCEDMCHMADTYLLVGDWASAAYCYELAEIDSDIAFLAVLS